MKIDIIKADYLDKKQAQEISFLMNAYATDPMGGGKPLPEKVMNNLAQALSIRPYAFTILLLNKYNMRGKHFFDMIVVWVRSFLIMRMHKQRIRVLC